MASNVFPMLSSSPPPIDDCPDDDDDDDEFGNFTSANIPFDSSFDSPVAVEKFKFKSGDNGVNNSNFSDEIHKFNSFSNSATPSPQEFVPNFSEENEHSKNGFIPIKHQNSKVQTTDDVGIPNEKSISGNEANLTSHKIAPCTLNSSSDSERFPPEYCDSHQNSSLKSSVKNIENNVMHDFVESELDFADFDNKPISTCDALQEKTEEISLSDESREQNVCDGPEVFTSECVTDIQFCKDVTEIEKDAFIDESSFSAHTFPCGFRSEVCESSQPDDFDDNQECKSNLSSNQTVVSHKPSECEYPISHDNDKDLEDVPVEVYESTFEIKQMTESINDFSDNEFDDFQSCREKTVSVQDAENIVLSKSGDLEYDDFQDFQYTSNLKGETDEFADFQDFSEGIIKSSIDATGGDDFADFSAVPFDSNKTQQSSVCSEFANFEEASFSAPADSSFQASSTSQKSVDTISTVINAIFPLSDNQSEGVVSDEVSPQILEQSNKSRRLWEKLHEVEQTPGLRFQWGVSHSFQQLLRSVNVDYHSILRTSSVPIFASGLSLLEPVKGLSNSVNHESEDRNHIPKDPIPPVEFDWNSSGLVNPLDSGQTASTLMDLSFLSSVDTDTSVANNDHSFENELLKPSPTFLCPENNSKTPILEQLLSKNVSSLPNSKITHRPSDLSQEAVRVLDQLPDLSFMQAKVLMFPISSKT